VSPSPALVGRDAPLAALRLALTQAEARRGQLVVVSGEPGIGKSALVDQVGQDASARGAKVVFGRAWELAEAPPYFPVWSGLRALGIDPPRGQAADADAFHLWERVLTELGRASAGAPMVWILEDLHAADLLTLDLLTFLARPVRALAVLVLVTTRDRDPQLQDRTAARLARLARDGQELHLDSLSPADVRQLAERVARRPLPPAYLNQLTERTGGNPLFVVECARAADAGPVPLPASVRELSLERIALLPPGARESLACGAIVGRDFSAAIVARMLDGLPAQVIDRLDPALRAGILLEPRPGQFRFHHILVRDAVEEALPAGRRAELHARAAQALATDGDAVDVLVERARHALLSMRPEGDPVGLAQRAARELDAQGAHDRALALYTRIEDACAAGLTTARPDAAEALFRAGVARAAGRHAEARRRCEAVLADARANGEGELMARAALVLGAELQPAVVDATLVAALREALSLVPPAQESLRCRLEARLAGALQPADDPRGPIELARAAITKARKIADPELLSEVLRTAGAALVNMAPLEESLALATEQLTLTTARGDRAGELAARLRLTMDHAEAGDFAAFDADVGHLRALSLELGHPRWRWRALLYESMRATMRGDFELSDRCVVEATQLCSLTDDPSAGTTLTAHITTRDGQFWREDRMPSPAEIEALVAPVPQRAVLGACIRLTVWARTEDLAATTGELATWRGRLPITYCSVTYMLVEAIALAGTNEERRRMYDSLLPLADRHLVSGHVPISYEGPVLRAIGLLDSSLGQHQLAIERLSQVAQDCRARGHQLWAAQATYDLARALAAAGQTDAAAKTFAEAAVLGEALKMPGMVARARARLGVAKAGPTSGPAPGLAPPVNSFALMREGDVWRVHGGGRSAFVRHSRGMELLARLVERPGEEIHVLALSSDVGASVVEGETEAIDPQALRAYRTRLDALEGELQAAEDADDVGRYARLERERDQLRAELGRAVGLGGRPRAVASATERARVNAQRRLKEAIGRIGEADAALGATLTDAVHTGTYCCFRP
jgi:tetratricopeptide (TPR) repeat protein